MPSEKPYILITNDDSLDAKGIKVLIDVMKQFGDLLVVAPAHSQSGQSHALTFTTPMRLHKEQDDENLTVYRCFGTPVDCVKIAINQLARRKPDFVVSGINHGSNSSVSAIYSGTVAAAREGCLNGIPSVAFSSLDFSKDADFDFFRPWIEQTVKQVLDNGMPKGTLLNVNFPCHDLENLKGIKVCRQAKGAWVEEFVKRSDPMEREYYWLTGFFRNDEPDAQDTDEWLLKNNFISAVPLKIEATDFDSIPLFEKLISK